MSCPHTESTTVAWCYGEADEAHAAHIARCEACQAVVADHELVAGVVAPLAPALAAKAPSRSRWLAPVAVLALAAALLLAVGLGQRGQGPPPEPEPVPVAVAPAPFPDDRVDARLDALSLELDALTADPSLL